MELAPYLDDLIHWLSAKDVPPCHHKPGEVWADGCCSRRRGRLVRFRLALLLMLIADRSGYREEVKWA
ncbi:MAG: hypothetical protein F6J87_02605 [Spirulina sp. SIO3F2]|nr:hypothetical protein [Spirulina sp. SIO3F2]